jgi:hypothetical protein
MMANGTVRRQHLLRSVAAIFVSICLGFSIEAQALDLLVTDRSNDAVYRYDGATGEFIEVFIASGTGGLDRPVNITEGPDGHLYIANFGPGEILKFDGPSELEEPVDVVFGSHVAYLLGNDTENIVVVDSDTGGFIREFGHSTLRYPHDMEFGPDGYLYVTTEALSTNLVQYYDVETDQLVGSFGSSSDLELAVGLTYTPGGNWLVTSWWDSKIVRYDGVTHELIDIFVGEESGGISGPTTIKYGPDGNLYVSNGNGIHRFDGETGAFIDVFVATGSGGLSNPRGFIFRGTLCLGDLDGNDSVDVADLLILLGNWGVSGLGDLDGDGVVGVNDLLLLLGAWGECG